ncbi:twin-arginine translocation pathway signal [Rhodobacteraceae bacterium NNCM2]|nr:twin-arginine translocation pathway signal [Coraliihabitans acroporae]
MTPTRRTLLAGLAISAAAISLPAMAEDAAVIEARVKIAEAELFKQIPETKELAKEAKGILWMPDVIKGGFLVGAAYGEGALKVPEHGTGKWKTAGYYSVAAASVGFQAGIQQTSQALFFLTDEALEKFQKSSGWEAGADAEVTFPSKGVNIGANSSTLNKPVIGFIFGEDGLLAGASFAGSKYSPIKR